MLILCYGWYRAPFVIVLLIAIMIRVVTYVSVAHSTVYQQGCLNISRYYHQIFKSIVLSESFLKVQKSIKDVCVTLKTIIAQELRKTQENVLTSQWNLDIQCDIYNFGLL